LDINTALVLFAAFLRPYGEVNLAVSRPASVPGFLERIFETAHGEKATIIYKE